jgi:hypothetical protein
MVIWRVVRSHISGAVRDEERFVGFGFSSLDFMTEPASALLSATETTDILRFLHRFADLMSTGSNADNLLRAARMLEAHIQRLKETNELLQVERISGDASTEARKGLEGRIVELETEMLALKSRFAEQQSSARAIFAEMERRQSEFLARAEEAEANLAAVQETPSSIPFGCIAVPLAALQVAKAQFEALAAAFEKSGNIVSQVMCEASASNLDRAILDSGAAKTEDRSKHAA